MKQMNTPLSTAMIFLFGIGVFCGSCKKEIIIESGQNLEGWTTETHSNDVDGNYAIVFDQNKVHRLDIVIDSEDWADMQDDLPNIASGGGPGGQFSDETPITVPSQVFYNGIQWFNVGIRYKGNSTLNGPYRSGNGKLPLRMDFDYFEDSYPEIKNQRFYGFKELSFANNYNDNSLIREKVASDIFRQAGIASPQTAFYRIYIDHGSGPQYFGLYTLVEVVFDQMLESQFGSNSGNCYKPDGDAAKFAEGTFNTDELEKKTNESSSDWSDLQTLYDVLNSASRTSDPESWKDDLEAVMDVDAFLLWLAVNTTIQNWDTYGRMTHNFYLYSNPNNGLITWIPWDNNEAFDEGKMGGALDLDLSSVGTDWPLINYLYGQVEYKQKYDSYIQEFLNNVYTTNNVNTMFSDAHSLIEPYVTGSEGEEAGYGFVTSGTFSSAMSTLQSHTSSRISAANNYLQ